jgi:hypothetical protein
VDRAFLAAAPYMQPLPTVLGQPLFTGSTSGSKLLLVSTSRQVAGLVERENATARCGDRVIAHAIDAVRSEGVGELLEKLCFCRGMCGTGQTLRGQWCCCPLLQVLAPDPEYRGSAQVTASSGPSGGN